MGYAFGYAAIFGLLGALLPYAAVWLDSRDVSATGIGLAASAGMMSRFAGALLGGFVADRWGAPRRVFRWAGVAVLVVFILHWPAYGGWAMAVSVLFGAVMAPMNPLMEASALADSQRFGFGYGPVRSVGSLAFVVVSVLMGLAIDIGGPDMLLVWALAASLALLAAAWVLPKRTEGGGASNGRAIVSAIARRDTLLVLGASALIQGSHGFYYWFSTLSWTDAGYSATLIGVFWGWGVVAEIVFLALIAPRIEHISPAMLLMWGAASGVVRWLAMALEPGIAVTFALQTLHAGTFAVAHLGVVLHIAQRTPVHARATAQALNSGITLGGVLALTVAVSGVLYSQIGAQGYAPMAAVAGAGFVLAALAWRRGA